MNRRAFLKTLATMTVGASALTLPGIIEAQQENNQPFTIYLTFDDGPFAAKNFKTGPTALVIQTLKDKGVSVTFFLHGLHINDWDGPAPTRYITEGHAIGNHLWRQGGNTTLDSPSWALLAEQYLQAEVRIRDLLQKTDPAVYQRY